MRHTTLLVFVSLALTAPALAGQVYQWKDAQGRTHYSDQQPPPAARNVQTRRYASGPADTPEAVANRAASAKHPVTLYVSECGEFCDKARKLLDERAIPYAAKDPQTTPAAFAEVEKLTGKRTIPVLVVGAEIQTGFDLKRWGDMLDRAGYAKARDDKPAAVPAARP